MLNSYASPEFHYDRSPDQDVTDATYHPVIVVGAGPVGLAAAIDLAQNGCPVVLLDDNNTVCHGSRAVCYGKRFMDIADRLGIGDRIADKGVHWQKSRVYFGGDEIDQYELEPDNYQRRSGFINLQQFYLEELLVDRLHELALCDLRWCNKVVAIAQQEDSVHITVETPEGRYKLVCDYLIACDGASSHSRSLCGLDFEGDIFRNRFLIVDLMLPEGQFSPERRFWFNPPFHSGHFTLLQPQADNFWRVEFDLGWDADPAEAKKPEQIIPRLKAFLGDDAEFDIDWASVYTYTCRRMERFSSGRVFFAGDSAHQVSPFSSRGANSGVEDIDNLIWKIRAVITGRASPSLLKSYTEERVKAADQNIRCSARSTEFIAPGNEENLALRNAVLALAKDYPFARSLVNSGRISYSPVIEGSSLSSEDTERFNS